MVKMHQVLAELQSLYLVDSEKRFFFGRLIIPVYL